MKICPRCSEAFVHDGRFCPECGAELVTSTDPYLGRTIAARYRLIKRLGGGGMASVYLARHVIIERLSALKILRADFTQNASHRERFLREARAVNRINHNNIVEITDYGETEGLVYLVMEYVSGESLLAHIQKGAFPWSHATRIAMQIASALARAHQAGVIHRDLKPENIMLLPGDPHVKPLSPDLVKLTDFGIAKIVDAPALTFSEQLFGTPGYIAPEYIEGAPASARTDLYSLGVCLYEMLSGTLPYDARGQVELLFLPITHPPIPLGDRVQGLPPEIVALTMQLLASDPNERPRDAFATHDALAAILRRYGSVSMPAQSVGPSSAQRGRSSIPTAMEAAPSPSQNLAAPTSEVGRLPTNQAPPRWQPALAELDTAIARTRARGGPYALLAERAIALFDSATQLGERVDRASRSIAELQARVDHLDGRGREFRANLGRAIDHLVRDRSRERAHIEALTAKRKAAAESDSLETPLRGSAQRGTWEVEALMKDDERARGIEMDLTFQIDTLQTQLDTKNEEHDGELVTAAGGLEGSLAAMRQMTNDLRRTIDEAFATLPPEGDRRAQAQP